MIKHSTFLHLRIPFSFFLMPVFMFALATAPELHVFRSVLVFLIIHLFLYPASNGFNSYFDRDEESIGGLKNPPPVSEELYSTALSFDLIALVLGLLIGWKFTIMLLIYGLVSKAYSHPMVRLKKYPWIGWFVTGLFQGFFTFSMVYYGITQCQIKDLFHPEIWIPATLSAVLLWGSYPMTQVYQHEEDKKRGDISLSLKLGIQGTFIFTALVFLLANLGFMLYFFGFYNLITALLFQVFLLPVLIYFVLWYLRVRKDVSKADYRHTMILNLISSACMIGFFILLILRPSLPT